MANSYGMKSSIEGQDISSTTINLSTINSLYPTPKVQINQTPPHIDTLSYTFSSEPASNSTTTLLTVAHGYSYTSSAWCKYNDDANPSKEYAFLPMVVFDFFGNQDMFMAYTDSTNLYIKFKRTGTGLLTVNNTTWNFKYQIFAEDGS